MSGKSRFEGGHKTKVLLNLRGVWIFWQKTLAHQRFKNQTRFLWTLRKASWVGIQDLLFLAVLAYNRSAF